MTPKGKQLNNFNEVHVEKSTDQKGNERIDIFRGSGGVDANDSDNMKSHSHTVIKNGQVVYDRDEYGTVFVNDDDEDD